MISELGQWRGETGYGEKLGSPKADVDSQSLSNEGYLGFGLRHTLQTRHSKDSVSS